MTSRIDTIKKLIQQAAKSTVKENREASLAHALHQLDNLAADIDNNQCMVHQVANDLAELYSIQPTK